MEASCVEVGAAQEKIMESTAAGSFVAASRPIEVPFKVGEKASISSKVAVENSGSEFVDEIIDKVDEIGRQKLLFGLLVPDVVTVNLKLETESLELNEGKMEKPVAPCYFTIVVGLAMDIGGALKDYEENTEGPNTSVPKNLLVSYASFQQDVANFVNSGMNVTNYVWKIAWVEANCRETAFLANVLPHYKFFEGDPNPLVKGAIDNYTREVETVELKGGVVRVIKEPSTAFAASLILFFIIGRPKIEKPVVTDPLGKQHAFENCDGRAMLNALKYLGDDNEQGREYSLITSILGSLRLDKIVFHHATTLTNSNPKVWRKCAALGLPDIVEDTIEREATESLKGNNKELNFPKEVIKNRGSKRLSL